MRERIASSIEGLRAFFNSSQSRDVEFRLTQLRRFRASILAHQRQIEQALWEDLHKSSEEAYLTEIAIVVMEIDNCIKHLRKWACPKRVGSPLFLFPSSSKIIYEPLGVALIIAPWNYPFQLTLNPLVGAIASGCCAMVKPAPASKATSAVIEMIIKECFDNSYIDIVQGGREVNGMLLEQKFDIIFFTGSPSLAKIVSRAAAETLTPMVLELGGKSPCIVDADANIAVAAKRIAWGKLLNAGQTCIAPDYLLVHKSVKSQLLAEVKKAIEQMYGSDLKQSRFYPRIINDSAFNRLKGYLDGAQIYCGGATDSSERYIEPTIIEHVAIDSPIMQDEIFGPLLPVVEFEEIEQALQFVNSREKPLAFYYFGKRSKHVMANSSSGGACVNDTIMHITNHELPFGGVGNSGMGQYHGHQSFLAFSNQRGVVTTPTWIDLPLKYTPYTFFELVKRIM